MERWPTVSVVSPVYNAGRAIERLLRSLAAQSYPRDRVEIILVDNDSTDGSWQAIQGHPEVIGLRECSRRTPGAPRNRGIREAKGEVVALIDADCWAQRQWLASGVRCLTKQRLDRVAGRVQFVFSRRRNFYELFDSTVNFQQRDFIRQKWSGSGNLFFRRELADEVGLFDATLRSGMDYEFGLRASRMGKSLGYCPEAIVYHYTRRSFVSLLRKFVRTGYGTGQLFRRHGYFASSLFYRKANYRPVCCTWRSFPGAERLSSRARCEIDLLWNALRMASNLGNAAGYFDLLGLEKERG